MDAFPREGSVSPLEAARRLAPLVASLRHRFDQDRVLPAELVAAIGDAGLFGLWLPRALGGPELPPLPFLAVIEELSRQDGSVGWCTVIPAGYARLAGALAQPTAAEIFGSGRSILVGTLNPTGKAVPTQGGYRVTGRWGYGSFIGHSDWVLGNCVVADETGPLRDADGTPQLRLCLFTRAETEVLDTWGVGGLRATGSHDYQVTDLFVPEAHSIGLVGFTPPPVQPGPLYATPMPSVFVSCIATVMLGIARAALEALMELSAAKTPMGSPVVLRDKPSVQADLARAEALIRAGRAFLHDELGQIWQTVLAGDPVSLRQRALIRLAAAHAGRCAKEAVDLAYVCAGGSSLYEDNRVERCFRDVHAAGQHLVMSPHANLEPIGKVLFGMDPGTARF
jgi:alkylation response protein AidB-like acyl-CoA dehydrogenase